MSNETQPGVLTWLHLSDLHVGGEDWQRDTVLDALVRDLPQLLEERKLRPDLLFVTGDVAGRGQRSEYDGADIVLTRLTARLGLERTQHVFLVPGNHDVERGRIKPMVQRDHATLLKLEPDDLRKTVGELLGDPEELSRYGNRLGEWCAFTERFLGVARSVSIDRPWRSDVVEVGRLRVGILSLCTAWASGPTDRQGSLMLGERQLHDMLAEARDSGARLTIALMHHPLHWLHEREHPAIRGRLEREVDVVLHGHVHDAHSALYVAGGSTHIVLGAGAAYAGHGQDPFHGFSVGRLDTTRGWLEVHHFTWSTRGGKWHSDSGAPGADERGCVSLPFSPARIASEEPRAAGTEVLATRLRRAAARVHATVDFAGLGTSGPKQHVALDQIFVPLYFIPRRRRITGAFLIEDDSGDGEFSEIWDSAAESSEGENEDPRGHHDTKALRREHRPTALETLKARLAANHKLVILGGPGSGKSTLCKRIVVELARCEGERVPVLLTVRDWIAEGKQEGLLAMAARQARSEFAVPTDEDALGRLFDHERALLVVDGVDEAADPEVRRKLRNNVHAFVTQYPNVSVLVTSRIAGYHDVPLDDEFEKLTLEPFDDEALEEFVHRWYDLIEVDPAVRLRKRMDLLHALEAEPRAKALARNPLLATLIGMVHFSRAQLPGDRAKLYGLIIELLLVTWPAERKRELPELHGTVQQPMLEKLALRLQEQRAGGINREDQAEVLIDIEQLESMLEEFLGEQLRERSAPERRYLARKWGKWLVDGCGLLQEQQPGRVGFLHLSLMEYMAGRALFERSLSGGYDSVAELVIEKHQQTVWHETLLLMLGSENRRRELGQAVMERLLSAMAPLEKMEKMEKMENWVSCEFGLALLREELDIATLREPLLERTCETVAQMPSELWRNIIWQTTNVISFSRVHGRGTRKWLHEHILSTEGDQLVGSLAVSTGALKDKRIADGLITRSDLSSTTAFALLDFGPAHRVGRWARERLSREIRLAWTQSTPLEGVIWRSFEGLETGLGLEWIPALIARASWIAHLSHHEARRQAPRALPTKVSWCLDNDVCVSIDLAHSLGSRSTSHNDFPPLRFTWNFARYFAHNFARDFARNLGRSFAKHFIRDFTQYFAISILPTFVRDFAKAQARQFTTNAAQRFGREFVRHSQRDFERDLLPRLSVISDKGSSRDGSGLASLWAQVCMARAEDEAKPVYERMFVALMADAHSALMSIDAEEPDEGSVAAAIRIENRWLNLFFTPLVDYVTTTRPLASHPELHALLLTYGLVQYQTTWEWPDCPYWRSWFSSDPPVHWLPAHVWYLVRSIQDPADPTHRQQADAALDRNDWPELAQALRETTVIPTPPEILALFDRGEDPRAS